MMVSTIPEQYKKYNKVFSEEVACHFPPIRKDDHMINFKEGTPDTFFCKIYPISTPETNFLRDWIDENLQKNFIRESKSPYASLMFLIKKKNGDYQVIQDYRTLNAWTIPDASPLPLIALLIEKLHGRTLFTKFNIRWGYHNIRIKEGDQHKGAFKTPLGQYEPMVMNFGLRNAPATFQRMMNKLLRPIKAQYGEDIQGYMDDILIATKNDLAYHREVVKMVLSTMKENSLFLKPEKCEFEKHRIEYLGILLENGTVQPDPSKISELREWPTNLKLIKEVQSTLGVLGYQRAFIPGLSHIAKPLTELLQKNKTFAWTERCTEAVKELIRLVTTQSVLIHPDPDKTFELEVDASNYATRAILFQRDERGKPRPIGYNSKTFNDAERRYDIYDKELMAVDQGLANWRHLLLGNDIIVHSDHANLTYYRHLHKLSDCTKRTLNCIMQCSFVIKHKPGILNRANALSRCPDFQPKDNFTEEIGLPS